MHFGHYCSGNLPTTGRGLTCVRGSSSQLSPPHAHPPLLHGLLEKGFDAAGVRDVDDGEVGDRGAAVGVVDHLVRERECGRSSVMIMMQEGSPFPYRVLLPVRRLRVLSKLGLGRRLGPPSQQVLVLLVVYLEHAAREMWEVWERCARCGRYERGKSI